MCRKKKKERSPSVHKKSRKSSSKFHKFIHYGLKQKLRCWVLAPLALGIIITVGISFSIILYVEPLWFSMTGFQKKEGLKLFLNRFRNLKKPAKQHAQHNAISLRLYERLYAKG